LAVSIIIHTSLIDERSSNNINATNTQDSVYLTVTIKIQLREVTPVHLTNAEHRQTATDAPLPSQPTWVGL